MNIRFALAIAASTLVVVACAPAGPKPTATTMAATCSTSNPGAQCSIAIREGSQYRCELGSFDVTPDMIELRGGRPVNLFWTLPEPYAFCGQDQVYLKPGVNKDTLQPYESFGSDSDDGSRGSNQAAAGKCKQKWHWNWANNGTDLYVYNIQFTDTRSGRKCTIDPWIRNG